MSYPFTKNMMFQSFKPLDSRLDYQQTQSVRVSPSYRVVSQKEKIKQIYRLTGLINKSREGSDDNYMTGQNTMRIEDGSKTDRIINLRLSSFKCNETVYSPRKRNSILFNSSPNDLHNLLPLVQLKNKNVLENEPSIYSEDIQINAYLRYLKQNQQCNLKGQQKGKQSLMFSEKKIKENQKLQKQPTNKQPTLHPPVLTESISKTAVSMREIGAINTENSTQYQNQHKQNTRSTENKYVLPENFGPMHNSKGLNLITTQKTKGVKQELLSVFASQHRLTSEQQFIYEQRNSNKIASLRVVLSELMKHINQLNNYLNNKKKLFYVMKKFIILNKNLRLLLLEENGESLIDPLSETNMLKRLTRKEPVYYHGMNVTVEKYDFSVQNDITILTEQIREFILQKRVEAYEILGTKIIGENKAVQKIEAIILSEQHEKVNLQLKYFIQKLLDLDTYIPVKHKDFSYRSLSMLQYNPHIQLENIEQKLGSISLVTTENRTIGKSIEKLVIGLDSYQKTQITNKLVKGDK